MLSRGFDLGSITGITNDLGSKLSAFTGKTSTIKNITSVKDAQKLLASSADKASKNTMNNETADAFSKVCDASSSINRNSQDYVKNLERALGIKNGMSICDESQVSEIDRILMMSTTMNASRKSEYKTMINKMVGTELGEVGYSGSIPSCLYGKVESMIDSLLTGLNGNINLKLDLLNMFNNKCFNDTMSSLGNSNLSTRVGSLMTDNMLQSGNKDAAIGFIGNKYSTDPNNAMDILGNSLSSQGNSDNASTKLMMYSTLNNNNSLLNTTVLNKSNMLDNLNNDNTINKNSTGVMNSMNGIFGSNDSPYFNGKTNLNNSANSYLSNTKSNDSLGSTTKANNMSLASSIKLANLFG